MKNTHRRLRVVLAAGLVFGLIAIAVFIVESHGELEQQALATLAELEGAVTDGNTALLAQLVLPPVATRDRSQVEGERLLLEILKGEVTSEGVERLRRRGQWGPLLAVYPEEARKWTESVGVDPALCVAFRLDDPEFRSEVVLVNQGNRMQVLRCNDVR